MAGIHGDYGIGQDKRAALILQDRNAEGVGEDAAQSFQLLASTERHAEIHRDDGICTHFAHHLDGNILDHPTIGQHMAIDFDRRENSGNGHAGAHGRGQRSIVQHDAISA